MAGLPRNLTLAEIVEGIRVLRPCPFEVATGGQVSMAAERLHGNSASWYYRPRAATGLFEPGVGFGHVGNIGRSTGARRCGPSCEWLNASRPRRRTPLATTCDCTAFADVRSLIAVATLGKSANGTTACVRLAGNDRSSPSNRRALRRATGKSPATPSDAPGPALACPPSDRPRPHTHARRGAVG